MHILAFAYLWTAHSSYTFSISKPLIEDRDEKIYIAV